MTVDHYNGPRSEEKQCIQRLMELFLVLGLTLISLMKSRGTSDFDPTRMEQWIWGLMRMKLSPVPDQFHSSLRDECERASIGRHDWIPQICTACKVACRRTFLHH